MCFEKSNTACNKDKNCQICFEKSFASNEKASFWSVKNNIEPWQIKKSSHKKFWFKCNFGHEFESTLNSISNGTWCPYPCCNTHGGPTSKICLGDCQICFDASFASHEKSAFWSNKNTKYHVFFHGGDMINLFKQQERDKLKEELCKQNGVFLIIVPYWIVDKKEFIEKNLLEKNEKFVGLV